MILFSVGFPEVTSVWGVSAVAMLDTSVNCMRVVDKKVNYARLLCCREL